MVGAFPGIGLNRGMGDQEHLLSLLEQLIANYRDGRGAAGLFEQLNELSAEWQRLGLPCGIPQHGRRDRLADIEPGF